ncbi:50S ribosomal protein L11 methyltransferase [soil metagenome]
MRDHRPVSDQDAQQRWLRLVFESADVELERLEAALEAAGALAITLDDAAGSAVFAPAHGPTPPWEHPRVTALFDACVDLSEVCDSLCAALDRPTPPPHRVEPMDDRVWEREWLTFARPLHFGPRLWICPADSQPVPGDGNPPIVVRLDPGLAFGAGSHASTALCLEWLSEQALRDAALIDYGCGSGILAIAALKLGARHATAIDIDPQAVAATEANARRNGVADRLAVTARPPGPPYAADILIANIVADTLLKLASRFAELIKPGGRLLLSGMLDTQVTSVEEAIRPWFDVVAIPQREQWRGIEGVRYDRDMCR